MKQQYKLPRPFSRGCMHSLRMSCIFSLVLMRLRHCIPPPALPVENSHICQVRFLLNAPIIFLLYFVIAGTDPNWFQARENVTSLEIHPAIQSRVKGAFMSQDMVRNRLSLCRLLPVALRAPKGF